MIQNSDMKLNLTELSRVSATIGSDLLHVQGPGGNTSLKADGTLWIKASGKWLALAAQEQVFIPLDLAAVRRAMAEGKGDPVAGTARDTDAATLRPSIETSFHAALDHSVVLHTHSVSTIALAVREDARDLLADQLHGLNWVFVPYARPGMPLTNAMIAAMNRRHPDVLVLANHGLVVGGCDCASALALLNEVERRISTPARSAPRPDLDALAAFANGTDFSLPADENVHRLGSESVSMRIASAGTLYPDHLVFLGSGMTVLDPDPPLACRPDVLKAAPTFVSVRGKGVLLRAGLSAAATALVRCLSDVVARIPADAPIRCLGPADEAALMDWDAEHLRQAMNK